MLKFDLYEKYHKQGEKFQEMLARYVKKEQEAGQRVQDLKAESEALLKQELQTGKDLAAEKDKVRKQIAEAESAYAAAHFERNQAYAFASQPQPDAITAGDVVQAFNNDYVPSIRAAELAPIIERMRKARAEYLNCAVDLFELEDKYSVTKREIRDMCYNYYSNGKNGASPVVKDIVEWPTMPRMTKMELDGIENYRKLPSDVERVKNN